MSTPFSRPLSLLLVVSIAGTASVIAGFSGQSSPQPEKAWKDAQPGSGLLDPSERRIDRSVDPAEQAAADLRAARSLSRAFQRVAKDAENSVVHIVAKAYVPEVTGFGFFAQQTGRKVLRDTGLGSGAIVSTDGLILTNNHVVANAAKLDVRLRDGRVLEGRILGLDSATDLAVVKIEAERLTPLGFADSDALEVGEWVVAIGSPFGFANTVTSGIVSAKGRGSEVKLREMNDQAYKDFIQTDAAINPGNSGGPLLNLEGKIVGINSAIASRAGGSEGIGFAIPATIATAVMDAIVKNGRVVRGYLGASFADLVGADADALGLASGSGVLIRDVPVGTPADAAGLKSNDVIVRYQNRPMTALTTLRAAIGLTPPGTVADLELIRDGKPIAVKASIGDYDAALKADIGVDVRTLTQAQARRLGYRNVSGVQVTQVRPGGFAQKSGLQRDDIILQVDGQRVQSPEEFAAALAKGDPTRGIILGVIRGDDQGSLTIQR